MGCDTYERDTYDLNKDKNKFWVIVEFKEYNGLRQNKFTMCWKEIISYIKSNGDHIENVKIMRGES